MIGEYHSDTYVFLFWGFWFMSTVVSKVGYSNSCFVIARWLKATPNH